MVININTSLAPLNSLNQLSKTIFDASSSLEKISSGLRINKAGDDAAGLAISEKMKSLINGYNQAIRNAEDGTSVIQVADGALSSTESVLQRMRDLAVQSSNDTLTDTERGIIQNEFDSLLEEIDNIAGQTEFNGQKLLDGTFTDKNFHIGANTDENISVSIDAMSASGLNLDQIDLTTQSGANSAISVIDEAIEKVSAERGELGATQNRLGYSVNDLQVSSVNMSAAESRIRDVFTSKEIMNQVRNQLLMQATIFAQVHSKNNAQDALYLLK